MPNHWSHKAFENLLNWSIKSYTCKDWHFLLNKLQKQHCFPVCFVCSSIYFNQQHLWCIFYWNVLMVTNKIKFKPIYSRRRLATLTIVTLKPSSLCIKTTCLFYKVRNRFHNTPLFWFHAWSFYTIFYFHEFAKCLSKMLIESSEAKY